MHFVSSSMFYLYSFILLVLCLVIFISSFSKIEHNLKNYRLVLGLIALSVIIVIFWLRYLYNYNYYADQMAYIYEHIQAGHPYFFAEFGFVYLYGHLVFNHWIVLSQMFICLVFLCIIFVMWYHPSDDSNINFGAPILMFFCLLASLMLVTVNDLFLLYLIIELQSFSLYLLVGIKRNSYVATNTSLKYFIYGAFSSCLIAFGISLVFGSIGSIDFYRIWLCIIGSNGFNDLPNLLMIGLLMILGGFFFKLGVFPFHGWLPEIYEGAPLFVTFFLSIIPKVSVILVLFRTFPFIFDYLYVVNFSSTISFIVICCAVLSILLVL